MTPVAGDCLRQEHLLNFRLSPQALNLQMRLLEHRTRHFRLFLNSLNGTVCPLCTAIFWVENEELDRLRKNCGRGVSLCGGHLSKLLAKVLDASARVAITRSALATRFRTGNPWPKLDCGVCAATNSVVATLARAVHKMDSQLRFQKAIEAAPLLCKKLRKGILPTSREKVTTVALPSGGCEAPSRRCARSGD
jgi:hypothetical protein